MSDRLAPDTMDGHPYLIVTNWVEDSISQERVAIIQVLDCQEVCQMFERKHSEDLEQQF